MNTKKVSVELYVDQVRDGTDYKGHMKIADTKLDYEIHFDIPIDRLNSMGQPKDISELRRTIPITMKRDNAEIEITNEEYGFFTSLIIEFVIEFYFNPQTRGSNKGQLGEMLRGGGVMAHFGASMSVGMKRGGIYEFPIALCEMLSSPKFGCALITA